MVGAACTIDGSAQAGTICHCLVSYVQDSDFHLFNVMVALHDRDVPFGAGRLKILFQRSRSHIVPGFYSFISLT